jgi:hypothetical protein
MDCTNVAAPVALLSPIGTAQRLQCDFQSYRLMARFFVSKISRSEFFKSHRENALYVHTSEARFSQLARNRLIEPKVEFRVSFEEGCQVIRIP